MWHLAQSNTSLCIKCGSNTVYNKQFAINSYFNRMQETWCPVCENRAELYYRFENGQVKGRIDIIRQRNDPYTGESWSVVMYKQ
jgi:hypothetical protein